MCCAVVLLWSVFFPWTATESLARFFFGPRRLGIIILIAVNLTRCCVSLNYGVHSFLGLCSLFNGIFIETVATSDYNNTVRVTIPNFCFKTIFPKFDPIYNILVSILQALISIQQTVEFKKNP